MDISLKHQTREQFLARLRQEFAASERERCVYLGGRVLSWVQAGDLTDAECRAAWGKTVGQWNALKAAMQSRATARNTVRSAVGE